MLGSADIIAGIITGKAMPGTRWDRRKILAMSAGAAIGIVGGARDAAAQQVKWSSGTEPPKLKAPANACDCHHHIYGSQYKVDPRTTLRPGDATVEDYRQFQKRIGTSRNVVVQPSTYGTENTPTLDAVAAFDLQIGRVLQALDANGAASNTIVIFTSDNGGERYAATWPFTGRKTELLEGGIRIPVIVRWPARMPAGRTSEQVMISMDWMPTLLAAA